MYLHIRQHRSTKYHIRKHLKHEQKLREQQVHRAWCLILTVRKAALYRRTACAKSMSQLTADSYSYHRAPSSGLSVKLGIQSTGVTCRVQVTVTVFRTIVIPNANNHIVIRILRFNLSKNKRSQVPNARLHSVVDFAIKRL